MCSSSSQKKQITSPHPQLFTQFRATKPLAIIRPFIPSLSEDAAHVHAAAALCWEEWFEHAGESGEVARLDQNLSRSGEVSDDAFAAHQAAEPSGGRSFSQFVLHMAFPGHQANMTGGGIVGGGETGHPQTPKIEIAQSYDGDGAPVKRIETRRTEELIGGGPQTEISTVVTTTYYVRSSALGGQVALERESRLGPNLNMTINKSYVYAGNERIAEYTNQFGVSSISWKHSNPVTGTILKSQEQGAVFDHSEFDPFGAEVGSADPYFGDEYGDYIEIKGQEPLYIEGGDPFDLSGGCTLDGLSVSCSSAMQSFNSGGAAFVPGGQDKQFKDGRWEFFRAFADGTEGYLLLGAKVKPEGGWYDPNSRTEGRLRRSMGLGFDFGPQVQQQQGGEWGNAGNPKNNARNFFQNFDCGNVINNVAKAARKSTWQDTLDKAIFISLSSDHPDWNSQLVDLGYSADLLKEQDYPKDMTLGAYFSQLGKKVIGLTIPSKNTVYLGEIYRNSRGIDRLKIAAHETKHLIFGGTHLDIAKAFQDHAGFLPGTDLSKIPDDVLSRQIDAWVFDRRCGKD